jgi:hypothetical protein
VSLIEERIETLGGRRTVVQFGDQSGAAFFRQGHTPIIVEIGFEEPSAVDEELRRVVEGLRLVDATTWHKQNGMTRLASEHA